MNNKSRSTQGQARPPVLSKSARRRLRKNQSLQNESGSPQRPLIQMSPAEAAVRNQWTQMNIPLNEQDTAGALIHSSPNSLIASYLAALVAPKGTMSRVPDSFLSPTALVRSITSVEVPVNVDGTANSGRFSMAIQPTLGSLSGPIAYKIAMVDSSVAWPTDFTVDSAFVGVLAGADVRLDQFYSTLTQPFLGVGTLASNVVGTEAIPFGPGPLIPVSGYGLAIQYDGSNGRFNLPVGQYLVAIAIATGAGSGELTPHVTGAAAFLEQYSNFTTTATGNFGFLIGYLSIQGLTGRFNITCASNPIADEQNTISIATMFDDNITLQASDNYGLVSEYRPVAMSALATYVGPEITNGGIISGAYVPGNSLASQFFTANNLSSQGNLTNWENLNKVPTSYNGKINDGVYVWWSPESVRDLEFATPQTWNQRIPPSLVISGQFQPGTDLAGQQTVVRLEIVTQYEIVTNSQLWERTSCVGSQALFDQANQLTAGLRHAMPNAIHLDSIKKFFGKVASTLGTIGKKVYQNRATLLPMAETALGMLL